MNKHDVGFVLNRGIEHIKFLLWLLEVRFEASCSRFCSLRS